MVKTALLLFSIFLALLLPLVLFRPAEAAISSCGISITPSDVQPNTSENSFSLTFTNTDTSNIKWFRATKPFSGLTTDGTALAGWLKTYTVGGPDITLSENTLTPGNSITLRLTIGVGDISGSTGSWIVEGSDDPGGANPINCTGSTSLSVSGSAPDTTAPVISGISVSDVTSSSVKVSWSTDEASTSKVQYDVNAEYDTYPFSHNDTNQVTSHSVTVTNSIAANTTYYYRVCSTDGSGNETCSGENSFTTAKASSAATTTATATSTPTPASASSTTPKVILDTTRPSVLLTSDFSEAFEQAPLIEGRATDNKGVTRVDYSIDDGKNWLPADTVQSSKLKVQTSVEFEFTPFIFEDGNYSVKVRAFDASGNIGVSKTYTLVIDRLPPQVGGSIFSIGAQILSPTQEGLIFTLPGLATKITLSAVGGATEIDIVIKGEGESGKGKDSMHSLVKNPDSGLWSGGLNFREAGTYTLLAKSVDGAGNKTERRLNTFIVLPNGLVKNSANGVVKDAVISIYYLEPTFKNFVLWDGTPYGQTNPQKTKEDGAYSFYLPPGKYYLQINAFGFKNLKTNIFEIDKNLPITKDFTLEKSASITFGPLTIPLPSFSQTDVAVDFKIGAIPSEVELESTVTGAPFPQFSSTNENEQFSITDLFGKPTIITFLNSWSPLTSEQISISEGLLARDEINLITIFPQESISKISLFQKRGDYKLILLADPDGELVEPLGIHSLPTHIFLDRRGIITNTKVGVLSEEELREGVVGSD